MTTYGVTDVHYDDSNSTARAALVTSSEPTFAVIANEHTAGVTGIGPYRPGAFYTRELPALRAVLAIARPVDVLIIDGYVDLAPDGQPGLGARVHDEFGVPVIGVAKTMFRSATHAAQVLRGRAIRPLYVTAAGLPIDDAAAFVSAMAGPYRLPDAISRVDHLARGRA